MMRGARLVSALGETNDGSRCPTFSLVAGRSRGFLRNDGVGAMTTNTVWLKPMPKTVWLVTGASGYLASELCKRIKSDFTHVYLIGSDLTFPEHTWLDEFIVGR